MNQEDGSRRDRKKAIRVYQQYLRARDGKRRVSLEQLRAKHPDLRNELDRLHRRLHRVEQLGRGWRRTQRRRALSAWLAPPRTRTVLIMGTTALLVGATLWWRWPSPSSQATAPNWIAATSDLFSTLSARLSRDHGATWTDAEIASAAYLLGASEEFVEQATWPRPAAHRHADGPAKASLPPNGTPS